MKHLQLLLLGLLLVLLGNIHSLLAQPIPFINRQIVYGGLEDEEVNELIELSDGSFLAVGVISNDGNTDDYDFLLIKLNNELVIDWVQTFGVLGNDIALNAVADADGGAVVIGTTLGNNNEDTDAWVIHIDSDGELAWEFQLGGSEDDALLDIIRLETGNYVAAGYTKSDDEDIPGNAGAQDMWFICFDATGTLIWNKTFGEAQSDKINTLVYQASTQQLFLAGSTSNTFGDSLTTQGLRDYWLVKTDLEGNVQEHFTYGGSQSDIATEMCLTSDGGIAIVGESLSYDGDVNQHFGIDDLWVIKLDAEANITWQATLGDTSYDLAHGIAEVSGGDIVVLGVNFDAVSDAYNYLYDLNITRLNKNTGAIIWQDLMGGSQWDFGHSIVVSSTNNYVIGGFTDSTDGDVGGEGLSLSSNPNPSNNNNNYIHGSDNVWILELQETYIDQVATFNNSQQMQLRVSPNPLPKHSPIYIQMQQPKVYDAYVLNIYGLDGKLLLSKPSNCLSTICQQTLLLPNLKAGIYLVQLCSDGDSNCVQEKLLIFD